MTNSNSAVVFETRPIPKFPGYYAREDGTILSTKISGFPHGADKPLSRAHIVRPRRDGCTGYLLVKLSANGKKVSYRVHTLILMAFVGPAPDGFECRHLDGDKFNNKPSNLRWGTRLENMQDRMATDPTRRSFRSSAKLSEEIVKEIRTRYVRGKYGYIRLARDYAVSRGCIQLIVTGVNWKYLLDEPFLQGKCDAKSNS